MKAVIVDDEPRAIISLKGMLEAFADDVEVVDTASSAAEAKEVLSKSEADLVFMDIELQDATGIEVVEQLGNTNFLVLFVTAYDEYTIQALRLRAFDYLLKPVDPDDLEAALHKAKHFKANPDSKKGIKMTKISVPTRNGLIFIKLQDIVRLQSDNTYTYIHTKNERPLLITKTLKSFENSLKDSQFMRVHQSHIVNFDEVTEYTRNDGGFLILSNGDEVPLSRRNKHMIEKAIDLRLLNL